MTMRTAAHSWVDPHTIDSLLFVFRCKLLKCYRYQLTKRCLEGRLEGLKVSSWFLKTMKLVEYQIAKKCHDFHHYKGCRWLHHHYARGCHVRFYLMKQSLTLTTWFLKFNKTLWEHIFGRGRTTGMMLWTCLIAAKQLSSYLTREDKSFTPLVCWTTQRIQYVPIHNKNCAISWQCLKICTCSMQTCLEPNCNIGDISGYSPESKVYLSSTDCDTHVPSLWLLWYICKESSVW